LRDEFGFAPVGDLRQALAALAANHNEPWVHDVLLYRFSKGSGLEGHNLGNLLLLALQDLTKSTPKAIKIASQIFGVTGNIYPITNKNIQLVIEYEDGTIEIGEHNLDLPTHGGETIVGLKTSPRAKILPQAQKAIRAADYLIIGPGDVYGSILPNLIVDGASQVIKSSRAKIIYVLNLMSRYSQTHNLTAQNHVDIIQSYLTRPVDFVITNTAAIPPKVLAAYRREHEHPIVSDLHPDAPFQVIRAPIIKTTRVKSQRGDHLRRSYLRHDPDKLARLLIQIMEHTP
jgi:uncharacterized cofD-like protein